MRSAGCCLYPETAYVAGSDGDYLTARKYFSDEDFSDIQKLETDYKGLAKQYHPDVNGSPDAGAVMTEINNAHDAALRYVSSNVVNQYMALKQQKAPTAQTEREAVNALNAIADSGMEPPTGASSVSPNPVKTTVQNVLPLPAANGPKTAEVPGLLSTEKGRFILNLLTNPQIKSGIDNAGKTGYANGEPLPISDVAGYLLGKKGGQKPASDPPGILQKAVNSNYSGFGDLSDPIKAGKEYFLQAKNSKPDLSPENDPAPSKPYTNENTGEGELSGNGANHANGPEGTGKVFKSTPELEDHIQHVDPSVPRSRGIGGAHNRDAFFKNDVKIVNTIPSKDIPGVTYYGYTIPLLGKDGKPVGGYGTTVFYKTVYDPSKFSDSEYLRRGLEAANDSYVKNGKLKTHWEGFDYGRDGKPTSFFPDVPEQ